MKDYLVYIIFILIIMCGFVYANYYFLIDYLKLKRTVFQLKDNLRSIEEDHGIFKGSEKE